MDAVGAKLRELVSSRRKQCRERSFFARSQSMRVRFASSKPVSRLERISTLATGAASSTAVSTSRAVSGWRPWRSRSRGIVWCRWHESVSGFHCALSKPIAAETRRVFAGIGFGSQGLESGFPCHRTVFSPDFPAPAVYQATRTGQSLPRFWGFWRFSANLRAHEPVEMPASSACFRLSEPIGNDQAHRFSPVGLSLLGIYFAAAARPAAADPSRSSLAERRHDDVLPAIPCARAGDAARVIDERNSASARLHRRNASDNGRSDACHRSAAPVAAVADSTPAAGESPTTRDAAAAAAVAPTNPVIEAIRKKLADRSSIGKDHVAEDVATAASFYDARTEPLWTKDGA